MATRLKNLIIRKVDFVDEGANPDAHIGMVKRRGGAGRQDGGESPKGNGNVLKKLFGFIGKAAGMAPEEINSTMEEILKGDSFSFDDRLNAVKNQKIVDEIWDTCYALQAALCSIVNDGDLDSAGSEMAMKESLDEFYSVVQEAVANWSGGNVASIIRKTDGLSEPELEVMKSAVERMSAEIEKAAGKAPEKEEAESSRKDEEGQEGDGEEMGLKIDKSKLTEAEKAFLESIEKRYGMEEGAGQPAGGAGTPAVNVPVVQPLAAQPPAGTVIGKSVELPAQQQEMPAVQQADSAEDVYKGLHPAVKAELEGLKKFREAAEEREIAAIAKKYEIIGKKSEELVPLLKSLRAAGGTAYNDMIALLDQTVDAVEKSGMFSEIGKSGHGSDEAGAAEAKVEAIAKGYMEKDPSLDYASAMAKAWEDNPALMDEYEAEAGF